MLFQIRRVKRSEYFSGLSPAWIAGTSLSIVAIALTYWFNSYYGANIVVCPLRHLFGIPCPLCGGTSASFAVLSLRLKEAFFHNPLVSLGIPLFLAWTALWLGFGLRVGTSLHTKAVAAIILAALVVNWIYVLVVRS